MLEEKNIPEKIEIIEDVIKLIKKGMAECGTPFVKWDYLVDLVRKKTLTSKRRAEMTLWAVMKPYVQEIGEKKSERHKIGESKVGRTWLYWFLEE